MKTKSVASPLIKKKNKYSQIQPKIFQLIEFYNPSKHSTNILIFQILYLFINLTSIILGLSLLVPKVISPLFHEINSVIEQWNNTYSKIFRLLDVYILIKDKKYILNSNKTFMISYPYYSLLYYPQNFYLYNTSFIKEENIQKISNGNLQNFSINISLEIDNNKIDIKNINLILLKNEKNSSLYNCNKKKGNFNNLSQECKLVYYLNSLCIIIDSSTKSLYEYYKSFICDNYTNWYENYEVITWNKSKEPDIKDFINYNNFKILIGDIHEPYIWLSFQDKLINYSEIKDSKLGMWLLFINIILITGVLILYILRKNFKEQFLKNQQLEMNDKVKEKEESFSEENDDKKNKINKNDKGIPVPNPILK